jgi:hypothetical protein
MMPTLHTPCLAALPLSMISPAYDCPNGWTSTEATLLSGLASNFARLSPQTVRAADGYINSPGLIPAGYYTQMWDWGLLLPLTATDTSQAVLPSRSPAHSAATLRVGVPCTKTIARRRATASLPQKLIPAVTGSPDS